MIQIIAGGKGKGKTKILLDKVNTEVATNKGNLVYLDKNTKHMYELNKKVRLINVKDFIIESADEFIGFICGIISQDHDLEKVFLDSFLNICALEGRNDINLEEEVVRIINKLDVVSAKFHVDFVLSISIDGSQMPEPLRDKVIVSL